MPTQNPLLQKFHNQCAHIQAQKENILTQFKFAHRFSGYALANTLAACFDQVAAPNILKEETINSNGITYILNAQGYGLQNYREAEGGVRGDAYRAYLTLLLPTNVIISTNITEDSYQPELTFEIVGLQTADVNYAVQVLVNALQKLEP